MLPDGKTTFGHYLQQYDKITVIGTALVDYHPSNEEIRANHEAFSRGETEEFLTVNSKVAPAKLGGFRENEIRMMFKGQFVRVRRDLEGRLLVVLDAEGLPLELVSD